jgi:putative ABC transport system ATP-binding protein
MKTVIQIQGITKIYQVGDVEVPALRGLDFTIENGEFVAIMGASGSGKSTLMNILGCLDYPTQGVYFLDGKKVNDLDKNELANIRNQKIGFVFQNFNLLPRTSALDNVELPLLYDRFHRVTDPRQNAVDALQKVGLADRMYHDPNQLSGGEQQRVAIARALVNNPAILMADEATGNLDTRTSIEILSLFQKLNSQGITVLMVTHEPDLAQYGKRVIELRDGVVLRDEPIIDRQDAEADLKSLPTVPEPM